ncbi:CoA transferase [Streptomyces sp. DHE17-7]|uniref:CoA transferase n=1 Tax=Streptomyces sp. DHE17-7 TaxID=2759949 RepID=UPI0022EA6094|nr:CoA transferase [Streptomyces sp. DHE17-7]MBJ6619157.1 CoA transferase [Streptomyces sp. DHE17-7]
MLEIPQAHLYENQLGHVQPRTGNRSQNNAPRNTYRTADGTWVAVSTSAQSVAEIGMRLGRRLIRGGPSSAGAERDRCHVRRRCERGVGDMDSPAAHSRGRQCSPRSRRPRRPSPRCSVWTMAEPAT